MYFFFLLTYVMERANAHFQMKTNLLHTWSKDTHNVMQRSKNRNKAWYLRHCPHHTHTHRLFDTQRHTHLGQKQLNSHISGSNRAQRQQDLSFSLQSQTSFIAECTVWAEEAATWSIPSVSSGRRTSGRRRATRCTGSAWSWKPDHNTSRWLFMKLQTLLSIWRHHSGCHRVRVHDKRSSPTQQPCL